MTCSSKFGNILQKTKHKVSNTGTNRNGQKFKRKPKVGNRYQANFFLLWTRPSSLKTR